MNLVADSIKPYFELPSQEELEAQAILTLPFLDDKISRIVFSYLFDINRVFGSTLPALINQSEKNFGDAAKKTHSSTICPKSDKEKDMSSEIYPCQGAKEYSFRINQAFSRLEVSALFLEHILEYGQNRVPYLHLDIGGGSGDFAWHLEKAGEKIGYSVEGHTISASDLRAKNSQVPDTCYHIYNASKILTNQFITSRRWNSIVCKTAIFYLEDNARNLAEFYELLAPGGLLVVDLPSFLGIHESLPEMIEFLNEIGYAVIAFYKKNDILEHTFSTLIVQKTHPHLHFPITYDKESPYVTIHKKEQALYAPDSRFIPSGDNEVRKKQISIKTSGKKTFSITNLSEIPKSVFPKASRLNELYQKALIRQSLS